MHFRQRIVCVLFVLGVGSGGGFVSAEPTDITVPGSQAAPPPDTGNAGTGTETPPEAAPASPAAAPASPAAASAGTSTLTLPSTAPSNAVTPASESFWPSGRLPFHVSAKLTEIYDDNIFIQPNKTSDFITQFTLKAELKLGDQRVADGNYIDAFYAPTFAIFADHSSEDFIDQDVEVYYQHRFSRLALSVDQSYAKTTATSISIGNLVTSDVYNTNLKADYAYSDKLDITSQFIQTFTDYDTENFMSSEEWALDDFFLYHWDSKLSLGFGPKFGFMSFADTPLQTYQQFLPRVQYNYSDRLTFTLAGGLEYRQYNQAGQGDLLTGIFDFAGTYHPWLDTSLSITGSRHYVPAYGFIGQDYLATSVGLNARQKFLKEFTFNAGFGYENDDYLLANTDFAGTGRTDDYLFASTGLDWSPNTWLLVSGSYKYQQDGSNIRAFSFNDNQLELSIEASY